MSNIKDAFCNCKEDGQAVEINEKEQIICLRCRGVITSESQSI